MPEPFLHLSDVGFMGEGVGSSGGAHGVHTQPIHLHIQACRLPIFPDDVSIDGVGIERPLQLARAVVAYWAEQRPIAIRTVTNQ